MKIDFTIELHPDSQNRPVLKRLTEPLEKDAHEIVCAIRDFEA